MRAILAPRWVALHPLARHPPRLGDLSGGHTGCNKVAPLDRQIANPGVRCACGSGCNVEPHMSADIVLRHALAVGVHHAEAELRAASPARRPCGTRRRPARSPAARLGPWRTYF